MFIYYRGLLVGAKIIILMDNGQWIMDNLLCTIAKSKNSRPKNKMCH